MDGTKYKTVTISVALKKRLDSEKLVRCESYTSVIERGLTAIANERMRKNRISAHLEKE